MDELDEIVGEFLVESYENLDRYDDDLLALERDPTDLEVLSSIFRTIHTVKGTSGFFGFDELGALAHVAENLLGKLREGELEVTRETASALLETGDAIRRMLATIERTGVDGDEDLSGLVARLTAFQEPSAAQDPAAEAIPLLGELLIERGVVDPEAVALAVREQDLGDERRLGDILVDQGRVSARDVEAALADQVTQRARGVADTSVRVDVGLLDELMNLVGELVLARNQIVQLVAEDQDSDFAGASRHLDLITTELQEGVMKTRMQPIGNVWNKLPRVVRDLSLGCGKQVRLELVGQDTELDKTVIEAIKDPLTHLVRNAVDHGVEPPEVRGAAGKPAEGELVLRAFHEGGRVNIEISDDGAGIDVARVRAKAVASGLVTVSQAEGMTDGEALALIFAPGFSTAEAVTNVSGRGVGMDVVRTNIERIGGTVDVSTQLGMGTTFEVKIPLTLATVPALLVSSGGDRYAIPHLSLIELVRLEGDTARSRIELVHGVPVHRLRGRLLPIVDLAAELGGPRRAVTDREVIDIVVLHADGHQFGLVVDAIHDTLVEPLGSHLEGEASSVVWGMPGAVVGVGLADVVLPLSQLAAATTARVRRTRAPAVRQAVRS